MLSNPINPRSGRFSFRCAWWGHVWSLKNSGVYYSHHYGGMRYAEVHICDRCGKTKFEGRGFE